MVKTEIQSRTLSVIANVMGSGAFILIDRLDEIAIPNLDKWEAIGVGLTYTGPQKGAMSLWAPTSFMKTLCANMLGADDESGLTTGNLVDALKEILNMVLGNVLTEVYGNEPVFDLDLPQLLPAKTISTSTANSFRLWFSAEGEPIMFLVEIEPPKTK